MKLLVNLKVREKWDWRGDLKGKRLKNATNTFPKQAIAISQITYTSWCFSINC